MHAEDCCRTTCSVGEGEIRKEVGLMDTLHLRVPRLTGMSLGIFISGHRRFASQLKTYGEVFREYEFYAGAKSADAKGKPSGKQTVGLLRRRQVRVERIIYIGRESNKQKSKTGIFHSPESVYTEYPDPLRDEWETKILPVLKRIPIAALMRFSGRSHSMLLRTMAGRSRPRRRNQELLHSILYRPGVI